MVVPNTAPPWLTAQKQGEIALLDFWKNNGSFQDRYLREFIKDALFLEVSGICSSMLTVSTHSFRKNNLIFRTFKFKVNYFII